MDVSRKRLLTPSRKDLEKYREKAILTLYFRPGYIFRRLRKTRLVDFVKTLKNRAGVDQDNVARSVDGVGIGFEYDKTHLTRSRAGLRIWTCRISPRAADPVWRLPRRLVRLDEYSLRADTINFWTVCQSQLTAGDIIRKWGELGLDHPPFTLVAIKWMIDTFHLPVTHAVLAVIPAAFGILCIPVMFLVGLRIGGRGFGLVLAGLLALHPIHIQISREPYHYSLLLLGSCLMLLGTIEAFIAVRDRRDPGAGFFVATGLGMLGLTFSTFTGWSLAFIEGMAILGAFAWRWKKQGASPKALLVTTAVLGVLALPTLLSPGGLPILSVRWVGVRRNSPTG